MLKSTVKAIKELDYVLIAITGFLITIGIIILTSTATSVPLEKEDVYKLLNHQLLFGLLFGLVLAFFLSTKISLSFLKQKAPLFLLISLVLMLVVFLPGIGKKSGEASRWISLKYFSFQPSEILKLTSILYIASWLESRGKKDYPGPGKKKGKENLFTFLIILGLISLLLYLQSDLGTLGVILATITLMYFFSGKPLLHIVLLGMIGIIGLFFLVRFTPYRLERILIFLNPSDPMGSGYQIEQALIAVGSGKIFGLGLGMSQQKFGLLPHPMSDSIFAILAEETGFIGAVVLIFFFLLFLWRGYKIGRESKNLFAKLTALGITSWILIQAFVNIGSMIRLSPLTGIPLPFISYGGTALAIELSAVGILLNISRSN